MITKITGEQPFQVLTNNFSISPSNEGYTLQISADGKQYSNLFSVGAGVTRLVTGVAANSFYRLLGNQSEVSVNWMKTCVTEGGGGASGTELQPIDEFPSDAPEGTVVAYTGSSSANGVYQYDGTDWIPVGVDDLSDYYTSAQTEEAITSKNYITSAYVADQHYITSADTANFALSADVATLSAATVGKADAVSVSANTGAYVFPTWNEEGIITGKKGEVKYGQFNINGSTQRHLIGNNDRTINIYAPTTTGTTGQIAALSNNYTAVWVTPATINGSAITTGGNIVIETGDVAPLSAAVETLSAATTGISSNLNTLSAATESAIATIPENPVQSLSIDTIWKGTQAEYDAATESGATADPNTFYIIV